MFKDILYVNVTDQCLKSIICFIQAYTNVYDSNNDIFLSHEVFWRWTIMAFCN